MSLEMETSERATASSCWMKQTVLRSYHSDTCMGLCWGTVPTPGLRKICLRAPGLPLFLLRSCKNHPISFSYFKYISEPIWFCHGWAALCSTMSESVAFVNSFGRILCSPPPGLMVPLCDSSTRTNIISVICAQKIRDCRKLMKWFVRGKAIQIRVSVHQSDGTLEVPCRCSCSDKAHI